MTNGLSLTNMLWFGNTPLVAATTATVLLVPLIAFPQLSLAAQGGTSMTTSYVSTYDSKVVTESRIEAMEIDPFAPHPDFGIECDFVDVESFGQAIAKNQEHNAQFWPYLIELEAEA